MSRLVLLALVVVLLVPGSALAQDFGPLAPADGAAVPVGAKRDPGRDRCTCPTYGPLRRADELRRDAVHVAGARPRRAAGRRGRARQRPRRPVGAGSVRGGAGRGRIAAANPGDARVVLLAGLAHLRRVPGGLRDRPGSRPDAAVAGQARAEHPRGRPTPATASSPPWRWRARPTEPPSHRRAQRDARRHRHRARRRGRDRRLAAEGPPDAARERHDRVTNSGERDDDRHGCRRGVLEHFPSRRQLQGQGRLALRAVQGGQEGQGAARLQRVRGDDVPRRRPPASSRPRSERRPSSG